MKKDIHPEYRPVVFMDTTTGYKFLSGSTKRSSETVETHTHSTLDVKSSLKQMDAWIVSTKNTVSNNQPHHLYTVKRKQLRFGVVFFVSFIFSSFNFFYSL